MKRNKIISNTLRPYVGVLAVASAMSLVCVAALNKSTISLKKEHNITNKIVIGADVVVISLIAYFFIVSLLRLYKGANKFAIRTAEKYITKTIDENPDYKQFCNVLMNPGAMKRIATMISNELNKKEQTVVTNIVNNIKLAHKESEISEAMYKIINIIEEHASVHPEFTDKIYGALARESYDIYVRKKQNENAKLLRQPKIR